MEQNKNFLVYVFVTIIAISIALSAPAAFAVSEGVPASGSENGNEGNVNPTGGSENGNEGNVNPTGGSENGNETGSGSNGDGDTTPPGNNGGGSSRNTGGSGNPINQISNIEVVLAGTSIPTTTLTRGQAYTISWETSQSGNSTLNLVSVSSGSSISIGTSVNSNDTNTLNWTVPLSAALGAHMLTFTDAGNRQTVAPNLYTIAAVPTTSSVNPLGVGSGTPASGGQPSSTSAGAGTEASSVESESSPIFDVSSQAAQTSASDIEGSWSKYVIWFFLLLLIIAGALLMQERRNKNSKFY